MQPLSVILTKEEQTALRLLSKRDYARASFDFCTNRLYRLGFVYYGTLNTDPDDPNQYEPGISITDDGVDYVLSLNENRRQARNKAIQYWITTAIALAALALSIISLTG